jgi:uncharacterized protein (TIGR01319 family)
VPSADHSPDHSPDLVLCVDFGSTFTKAALVDVAAGRLVATAQHPTTLPGPDGVGDVLDGYDACRAALDAAHPEVREAEVLACSSAGGGLRIGVVGNEELITAEAGRRVALSSGGKVVAVLAGGLDEGKLAELRAAEPDVLLLVGGTDGGNAEQLLADAGYLARQRWPGPVVVAGDVEAQPAVAALLASAGTPCVLAANVVPRIGVLAPESARQAIREVFLAHVIGGKDLSRRPASPSRPAFVEMVRGATPDIVLAGVELLAAELGDTVVVDVGGATTDVHSVLTLDPETGDLGEEGLARDVVAPTAVTRTVEGDLGMRWSAATTVAAARTAGVPAGELEDAAGRRTADPGFLPDTDAERDADNAIAAAAVLLALRRHAGRWQGRSGEQTGRDLREVAVLVGSGGVLRTSPPAVADRILRTGTGIDPHGWQLPEHPHVVVDVDYVLAAIGLLALARPEAAGRLVASLSGWRGNR